MRLDTFLRTIEETGGIARGEAERAAQATLRTLGERITGGEAEDIAIAQGQFVALAQVVPERELDDVESELPREYAPLFSVVA